MKYIVLIILSVLISCSNQPEKSDAYGNFEATEVIISAESNGKVIEKNISEGEFYQKATVAMIIDTLRLNLQWQELNTEYEIALQKIESANAQINIISETLKNLQREKLRFENLFQKNAAKQKQIDDISGQINVTKAKLKNAKAQKKAIVKQKKLIKIKQENIIDSINRCVIKIPFDGTILSSYVEKNEIVNFAKPLFKLADISKMSLKVYISESQLSQVKLGQKVQVSVDLPQKRLKTIEGRIKYISDKAEFTPKTIQTHEQRVTLVYALKISVINDGSLKIGMPAEVNF